MALGRYSAAARRYYHHVVHGGTLTDNNVHFMVSAIETLEAEVTKLREEKEALEGERGWTKSDGGVNYR